MDAVQAESMKKILGQVKSSVDESQRLFDQLSLTCKYLEEELEKEKSVDESTLFLVFGGCVGDVSLISIHRSEQEANERAKLENSKCNGLDAYVEEWAIAKPIPPESKNKQILNEALLSAVAELKTVSIWTICDECEFPGDCGQKQSCDECDYRNRYVDSVRFNLDMIKSDGTLAPGFYESYEKAEQAMNQKEVHYGI